MKKAAPAKESGLEVMQAHFTRKSRSNAGARLAPARPRMYLSPVTVNPVAGCGSPRNLAHKRPKTIAGAIFVPAMSLYGGCAWEGFGPAGSQVPGLPHLRTAATHHVEVMAAAPTSNLEHHPMKHDPALNPSALRERAAAHRAMAIAALRADSSLSVRLKRYNAAMTKARALEAEAERQQTTPTRDPRTALAWLKAGKGLRIDALNLRDHLRHARALAVLEGKGGEA